MSEMELRSAHKCHKAGCDSQAEFGVRVHFTCREIGRPAHALSNDSTIKVCARHQDDVRGYLLTPANKENITTGCMENGFPEPDFLSLRVEFIPIVHEPVVIEANTRCDRDGCTNPAQWRIVFKVRPLAQGGKGPFRYEVMTKMQVCRKHRKETKPEDFRDPDSIATTRQFMNANGVLLPDLDTMAIEFTPLATKVAI